MFSLLNEKKNEQGGHTPPLFPLRLKPPPKEKRKPPRKPSLSEKPKLGAPMSSPVSATWTGRTDGWRSAHARGVPARLWEGRHGAGLISHRRQRGPSILIHRCASGGASRPSQAGPSGPSVGDLPFPSLPSSGPFPWLPPSSWRGSAGPHSSLRCAHRRNLGANLRTATHRIRPPPTRTSPTWLVASHSRFKFPLQSSKPKL
jgi:hypothetical protein